MKKHLRKAITLSMTLVLMLASLTFSPFAAPNESKLVSVPLVSNMVSSGSIEAIESDGKIYISLDDIEDLTGADGYYEKAASGNDEVRFDYGVETLFSKGVESLAPYSRLIVIDTVDGTMKEGPKSKNKGSIDIIRYEEELFFHAYPILTALGAICKAEDGKLSVMMPFHSFWDALRAAKEGFSGANIDWDANAYDSGSTTARVVLDTVVDLFTPGGLGDIFNPFSWGDVANPNPAVIEQALYVDLDKYDSTAKAVETFGGNIGAFVESGGLSNISNVVTAADITCMNVISNELVEIGAIAEGASRKDVVRALEQAAKDSDVSLLKSMKVAGNAMATVSIITTLTTTLQQRLNVEADRVAALSNVFNEDTLKRCRNVETQGFFSDARNVAGILNKGTILKTVAETLWKEVVSGRLSDAILKTAIPAGITKAVGQEVGKKAAGVIGKAITVVSLGGILAKLAFGSHIDATANDILEYNAVNQMRYIHTIVDDLYQLARDEAFMDAKTLRQLRDAYIIFYQTALFAHEQTIKMAENAPERYNNAKQTKERETAKCENIAAVLYKLYAAQPVAVPKFSSLTAQAAAFDKAVLAIVATTAIDDSEISLREKIQLKAPYWFFYDDYDGDGRHEAFVFMGTVEGEFPWYYNPITLYYVTPMGVQTLEDGLYSIVYDADEEPTHLLKDNGKAFVTWYLTAGGSGGASKMWGVKQGHAYEPKLSGKTDGFRQIDGSFYGWTSDYSKGFHDYIEHRYELNYTTGEFLEISDTITSATNPFSDAKRLLDCTNEEVCADLIAKGWTEKAFQGAFGEDAPYVEEMRFRGKDQTMIKSNSSISTTVSITVTLSREEGTVAISVSDTAGVANPIQTFVSKPRQQKNVGASTP